MFFSFSPRNTPKDAQKEVLLILSASNTADDRNGALAEILSQQIRVSIAHFSVGTRYFQNVCRVTNGNFSQKI